MAGVSGKGAAASYAQALELCGHSGDPKFLEEMVQVARKAFEPKEAAEAAAFYKDVCEIAGSKRSWRPGPIALACLGEAARAAGPEALTKMASNPAAFKAGAVALGDAAAAKALWSRLAGHLSVNDALSSLTACSDRFPGLCASTDGSKTFAEAAAVKLLDLRNRRVDFGSGKRSWLGAAHKISAPSVPEGFPELLALQALETIGQGQKEIALSLGRAAFWFCSGENSALLKVISLAAERAFGFGVVRPLDVSMALALGDSACVEAALAASLLPKIPQVPGSANDLRGLQAEAQPLFLLASLAGEGGSALPSSRTTEAVEAAAALAPLCGLECAVTTISPRSKTPVFAAFLKLALRAGKDERRIAAADRLIEALMAKGLSASSKLGSGQSVEEALSGSAPLRPYLAKIQEAEILAASAAPSRGSRPKVL